jgi:futalosine hydrolase
MQILLAAATEIEIAPFIRNHPSADVLVTGVGVPATIYHLTKRIRQMDYDLVIQAGIAGTFLPAMELGKVVVVQADAFADIGVKAGNVFSTVFDMGLADRNHPPFQEGWLVNPHAVLHDAHHEQVKAITVNTVTDDTEYTGWLTSKFNGSIETMEGAALHYVCLNEAVPFLQIRAISNQVGERDKGKWEMKRAIENLNREMTLLYEGWVNGK